MSLEIKDVDTLPRTLESFTKVEKIENPEMKFTRDNCKEEESIKSRFFRQTSNGGSLGIRAG